MPSFPFPKSWRIAALGLGSAAGVVCATAALAEGHYVQQAKDRRLVVVELFTSQGCSSCPAADEFQAELATEPDILALTFPVDYWDYLGWQDTFATPENSERQMEYAKRSQSGRVFTPQMIVDGVESLVGGRRADIAARITVRRGQEARLVPMEMAVAEDRVSVDVPAFEAALASADTGTATLWLFPFGNHEVVHIAGGENRGRSVGYTHVVRRQVALGQWAGDAATYEYTLEEPDRGAFGYAALLQADKVGPVIGAAWVGDADQIQARPMAPEPAIVADPLMVNLPR